MNVLKTHRNNSNNKSITIGHENQLQNSSFNASSNVTDPKIDSKTDETSSHYGNNHTSTAADEHRGCSQKSTGTETNASSANKTSQRRSSSPGSSDARPKYRQMHAYPGRPQLLRFSSHLSRDVDNESKIEKFKILHNAPLLNLIALKELSWSGIPKKMRAITWRLLSGYLPTSLERRNSVLERKRLDYHNLVTQYFRVDSHDETQQDTYRQIHIDVPRMNPHVQLFQQNLVQEMFERILFIWAIRHPASGYVQGINDLVTPFFIIFLQEALAGSSKYS